MSGTNPIVGAMSGALTSGALPSPLAGLGAAIMGAMAGHPPVAAPDAGQPPPDQVDRTAPEPEEPRRKAVAKWTAEVRAARKFHEPAFKQMREDALFAAGVQWPGQVYGEAEDRYVANLVLRHIHQRVATLYARNPRVVTKRRQKLLSTVWDGSFASVQQAQQVLAVNPLDPSAAAILHDMANVHQENALLDRIAKTLQLLFEYELAEQTLPFKDGMKLSVLRAVTAGVAWVKVGFQRAMKMRPEVERRIADMSEQLATIQRLSADIADGEVQLDTAEADQLQDAIRALSAEPQVIIREGLTFDYPESTAIIPDRRCRRLKGFLGAEWVAEEYLLTPEQVQEIYGVDVRARCTSYTRGDSGDARADTPGADSAMPMNRDGDDCGDTARTVCVWEIYSRADGCVYVVCDGWPDYLVDPNAPDVRVEGFWPWRPIVLNETYLPGRIWPHSDVFLLRDMQLEVNRARQGLREQRRANRPKMATAAGALDDEDIQKLKDHPANAIIELQGLQPGQDVKTLLQPIHMPGIDPNLYDVSPSMDDIMRVSGTQPANMGGTSGATATETSVAESSRLSSTDAALDDMDDMLTSLARMGGQLLMLNVSKDTVVKVLGPGAVWPEVPRAELVQDLWLEVKAGSAGRPNQARDVQNMVQLMPILARVPGINPEWMARELLTRMDERIDLDDAFAAGMPSIEALNLLARNQAPPGAPAAPGAPAPGPGNGPPGQGAAPAAQGAQGANNAPQPPGQGGMGPRPPGARDEVAGGTGQPVFN